MRAMRNSTITFGLVSVPVKVYKATDESGIQFKQFHGGMTPADGQCLGSIRYEKKCSCCENIVPNDEIAKGIHADNGNLVIINEDDLASVEVETGTGITVRQFVHADEIDPTAIGQTYYLEPSKESLEGYGLLRSVMETKGLVAVVEFSLRRSGNVGKTQIGQLRVSDNILMIDMLERPDDIRKPSFGVLDKQVSLRPELVAMAETLVEAMTSPFNASAYRDEYTDRLREVIAAKGAGVAPAAVKGKEADPVVDDLLAKLAMSVDANAPAKAPAKKAPAKKAPAKRAPAKKAAV